MAKNIIYYGPPGTGKTYHMQKLISDYTDYKITDDEIIKAYTNYSQDWLLFALIILQLYSLFLYYYNVLYVETSFYN